MARIMELGYIDDAEYTLRRARLLAERGYGDFSIEASLEGLGLPSPMIYNALMKIREEFTEEKRIAMLMEKRKGTNRQKMIRFLAGRGFPFEKILNVLGGDD
ncbi:MAG: RecX family transcriptional regulator [Deltaproteobacteria bacterium]|nr:RecX family transcriptional regulator [Deltaproteobacteria bacterium]